MKTFFQKHFVKILIVIIIVLAVAAGFFYREAGLLNTTSGQTAQKEAFAITTKVGKLMVLPVDEVPTIATVSDPDALKDQPFFAGAKKGDKVLIYTNSKKAILYDPVLNKIVNVSSLNIGEKE